MSFIVGFVIGYLIGNLIIKFKFKRKYIKECEEVENGIMDFFDNY